MEHIFVFICCTFICGAELSLRPWKKMQVSEWCDVAHDKSSRFCCCEFLWPSMRGSSSWQFKQFIDS